MSEQKRGSGEPIEGANTNQDEVDMEEHEARRATGHAGDLPSSEVPVEGTGGNENAERPADTAGTQNSTGSG